jgi:hypothetical protein
MKKTVAVVVFVCALVLTPGAASALSILDSHYLGSVTPGSPANAIAEVEYINHLLDMSAPSVDLHNPLPNPPNTVYTYVRTGNSCGTCTDASVTGGSYGNVLGGSVNVTGWTYLLGKHGSVSHVWLVAGLTGAQSLPLNTAGGGYSLYNPVSVQVPEGGATLGLLGLAMLAVGYLRRRMN